MQINVEKNVGGIEGLCIITPAVHGDARGFFMETYSARDMKEARLDITFVQDNQSMSRKGVLRGLHYQKQHPQGKLVRVLSGVVFFSQNAWDGWGAWAYSLTYHLTSKVPEGIATGAILLALPVTLFKKMGKAGASA